MRMIFTVLFLYPCLLQYFVKCASVEAGSHIPPPYSHLRSRRSSVNNVNSSDVSDNPIASHYHNGPLATSSSGSGKHLQTRQAPSTSEWIFSSLVQPPLSSSSPGDEEQEQQPPLQNEDERRRGNAMLSYRSLPSQSPTSNVYTNYYRNLNIYSQTPRRVDGGSDMKMQSARRRHHGFSSPSSSPDTDADSPLDIPGPAFEGASRRRASSSILPARNTFSATSKMPEVLSERDTGTTGLSRTAPATDPSLLASERPTSTQEMQIDNDESDEIELGSRGEFRRHGRKRGREMGEATESLSTKIFFPGSSTSPSATSSDDMSGTSARPYITRVNSLALNSPNIDPFDARFIDGWMRLYNLRKNSMSFGETRKSPIVSDQSADAKIISMLTIHGTPKCADKNGYCENIESYPRSFLDQVLNKTLSPDIFKGIFGETTDNKSVITDVEFKLRHEFEDTPLCSVREHTIYPKAAQNRKGKYMYIVNHDEYLQGIRVETCTRENDDCMFTEGHLPGYSSTCKQKFIYKKLLAFTPEGKAMPDTFRLPSCCVCYVRSMFISDRINPGADFGNPDVQTTSSAYDDSTWSSISSTAAGYPHRHSDDVGSSPLPPLSSSTESVMDSGSSITFPTTSKDDLSSFQVPSPTSSTVNPGDTDSTTDDSRMTVRQEFIFIAIALILGVLLLKFYF